MGWSVGLIQGWENFISSGPNYKIIRFMRAKLIYSSMILYKNYTSVININVDFTSLDKQI